MGLFTKKKKAIFQCPICRKEYTISLKQVSKFDYQYSKYPSGLIGKEKCEFCKVEMTLVQMEKSGKIMAFDEKWLIKCKKHEDAVSKLEDQIDNESKSNKEKLEDKLEVLEDKWTDIESAYYERRDKWQEKQSKS